MPSQVAIQTAPKQVSSRTLKHEPMQECDNLHASFFVYTDVCLHCNTACDTCCIPLELHCTASGMLAYGLIRNCLLPTVACQKGTGWNAAVKHNMTYPQKKVARIGNRPCVPNCRKRLLQSTFHQKTPTSPLPDMSKKNG